MEEDREGDGSSPSCSITATTTTTARDRLVCAHACMCKIEMKRVGARVRKLLRSSVGSWL